MKKTLQRITRGALAVILATSLTPLPSYAAEPSDDAVTTPTVRYTLATDIAKQQGMDTSKPMDLGVIVAHFPEYTQAGGAYQLESQLRLDAGTYILNSDVSVESGTKYLQNATDAQGAYWEAETGLSINPGDQVTIDLNGYTLTAKGNDSGNGSNGTNGGNADAKHHGSTATEVGAPGHPRSQPGIYLPETATLIIVGSGTLNAIGGNAGNGGNGGRGGNGYAMTHTFWADDYWGGGGASAGGAGNGASPGIGTRGGGVISTNTGVQPQNPPAAGTLKVKEDVEGSITLNLQGGNAGTNGTPGEGGNDEYYHDISGECWGGGGGGGGAGGAGGLAPGYGSGGQGGTAGINGQRGEWDKDSRGSHHIGRELCGASGTAGSAGVAQEITFEDPVSANYDVEIYYANQGKYNDFPSSKETRQGTVGEIVSVTESDKTPSIADHALDNDKSTLDAQMKASGTVLRVYFKDSFNVTYEPGKHGNFQTVTIPNLDWNASTPAFPGEPTADGSWKFIGWDKPVAEKVTGNATYTALWEQTGNTEYYVEKYFMKDDGTYPQEVERETRIAEVKSEVQATSSDVYVSGYTLDEREDNVLSGTVKSQEDPEGPLVLKVYLAKAYTITYDPGEHGTFQGMVFANEYLNASTPQYDGEKSAEAGWHFVGWSPEMADTVTEDVTYTAQWEPNTDTPYTLKGYFMVDGSYANAKVVTQKGKATTGATVTLDPIQIEVLGGQIIDHRLDPKQQNTTEAIIKGDGSTEFVLYFTQYYRVSYHAEKHGHFEGNKSVIDYRVNYGDKAPASPSVICDSGYEFSRWNPHYDSDLVYEGRKYYAAYSLTPAQYVVETYYEGDETGPRDIKYHEGTPGETVKVSEKELLPDVVNYTFDNDAENVLEGTVSADGTLVLKVYFKKSGNFVKGDANMNGNLNIVDAQVTYDVVTGVYRDSEDSEDLFAKLNIPNASELVLIWLMDVNEDSKLDAADALAIQNMIHNKA